MFHVVWGLKTVSRLGGYVADFCPICRVARPFRLLRITRVGHLYGVGIGNGRLLGHKRRCTACQIEFSANPERYTSTSPLRVELAVLIARTYPRLDVEYAERLMHEKMIQNHRMPRQTELRRHYIEEPFRLLAPMVEEFFAHAQVDGYMFAIPAAILAALLTVSRFLLVLLGPAAMQRFAILLALMPLMWFVVTVSLMFGVGGRWLRRRIYPVLARTLLVLDPSIDEIRDVLAVQKHAGAHIG